MEKVSLPKGTRDFGPAQMAKRQFIIDSIKKVFQKYGFQPLETPAMENLTTLTGKYGDEGDQLLFKILDSGEYFEKLKKFIDTSDISTQKVNQIEKYLYDFIWNLCQIITKEYDHTTDAYVITEKVILNKSKLTTIIDSIETTEESKGMIKLFALQEQLYLPSTILDILKQNPQLNRSSFLQNYLELHGQSISKILYEFVANYSMNQALSQLTSKSLTPSISEKGLRYDLTVPFARYVVMNRHEITFPFKRYQIQPVWRADRPQKGRYREFYQCDADVVGTDSLVCEAEIILMIKDAFRSLGISDYSIKINHRAILSGLAEIIGAGENESSLFIAIDKLDKIGEEKVKEELRLKNFTEQNLSLLFEILNLKGTTKQKIDFLIQKFSSSEKGQKGVKDFSEVLNLLKGFGANEDHVEFDIALARGLSYYTGCIFEVKINNVAIGSVSGGGRYDNLTAVFDAKEKSSGVGISFGIDRIYDAMEELKIFPKEATASSTVLIAHLDESSFTYGLKIAQSLREKEIASEIYPDQSKIKKQMEYADKKKIPFVIVIGSEEVKTGILTFKKMETGDQSKLSLQEIIDTISNK